MSLMSVTLEAMEITTPLCIKLEFLLWTFDSWGDQNQNLCKTCRWFFLPGLQAKKNTYHKVANSSLCLLVSCFQIFRRLMKGKCDAYVL